MNKEKDMINEIKHYKRNIKEQTLLKESYIKQITKQLNELKTNSTDPDYNLSNLEQMLLQAELLKTDINEEKINLNITNLQYRYNFNLPTNTYIKEFEKIKKLNIYELQYRLQLYKLLFIKDTTSSEYEECLSLVKQYKTLSFK